MIAQLVLSQLVPKELLLELVELAIRLLECKVMQFHWLHSLLDIVMILTIQDSICYDIAQIYEFQYLDNLIHY